jgi:hypothetical protein
VGVGGAEALFPNGTEEVLSFFTCQRFVHPDEYPLVMTVVDDPTFVTAEGGFLYAYQGGILPPYGSFSNDSGKISTGIIFDLWSSNETVAGCNGARAPKQLGEIEVNFPLNSTGGPDLSNLTVEKQPNDFLNQFLCTTVTTIMVTTSSTTTTTSNATISTPVASNESHTSGVSTEPKKSVFPDLYLLTTVVIVAVVVAAALVYVSSKPKVTGGTRG